MFLDSTQIYYCRTIGEIYRYYSTLANNPHNLRVPYFIVQPCLANKREYKICFLTNPHTGEECDPFLCTNPHPKGKAFVNRFDHRLLYEFAKRAKRLYEENVSTHVHPVFRVDIMRLQRGKFVVNEFESLEALIQSGASGPLKRVKEDTRTQQFLERFWYLQLIVLLNL
jgi:uncharacterized protein YbgA (DUF1722 family)